jgi:1-deoxy-D-xylulose-5-phosphate reductoisomerase
MNKGLEVIEASWLFGTPPDKIDIVVHPQSVVHSMVEFKDGSILAQLGLTDMRIAIQYALTYPDRWQSPLPSLDIHNLSKLEFLKPDREKFRCLGLAYQALRTGGTAPAVMNAANEVAVDAFLNKDLAFNEIAQVIESVLEAHTAREITDLDAVLKADKWAREEAREISRTPNRIAIRG